VCPSGLPTYVPPIPITLKMISNMQDDNEQMKKIIKKSYELSYKCYDK
jgi:hypothetical protein